MLTKDDYQSALDVQSAVNLSGVVFLFAEIMKRIWEEARTPGRGTQWKNRHPIVRLFAETIAEKCGSGMTMVDSSWVEAYDFCEAAAAGRHAHLVITVRDNEVLEYEVKGDEHLEASA